MAKGASTVDDDVKNTEGNEPEDAAGTDGTEDESNKLDSSSDNSAGGDKTFTQDDVTRMMAKEKKQGRSSAFNELGIDPSNKKMVEAAKAFFSKLSGGDSVDDDASDAVDDGKAAELESELVVANAKVAAMKQGVNPQYVDDVVTLISARMKQDESVKLDTAIGELKKKYPSWFVVEQNSKNVGKFGTGSSISASSSKGADVSIGKRLAAQRKVSSNKKSYWNN